MKSDTPRTDEAERAVWRDSLGNRRETITDTVPSDFARQLERELNEAITHVSTLEDEIDQLREANLELTKTLNNIARK